MKDLIKVSMRQQAIYLPDNARTVKTFKAHPTTSQLAANMAKLGFGFTEELWDALNQCAPGYQVQVLQACREAMGVKKGWTPLTQEWTTPTRETLSDYVETYFTNLFGGRGTQLPCGHIIPPKTFALERYNGCPYCKTPFQHEKLTLKGQGSQLKMMKLWTDRDLDNYFSDLLTSKTALDATQVDSLKRILLDREIPTVEIGMKETLMVVIETLVENWQGERAQSLFKTPNDILRYLWYRHTGYLQLIEPKVILAKSARNHTHFARMQDQSAAARVFTQSQLKLKYSRQEGRMVAGWLNAQPLAAEKSAEIMHPKRGMWVRFIRALRLVETSKKKGYENLNDLLEMFHSEAYDVWQGRVNYYRLRADMYATMGLLKQRPGLFARSLFSNMLWFGPDGPVEAFKEVVDQVPARLVFTLNMYADRYFDDRTQRVVKPLGGNTKSVESHALIGMYPEKELERMKSLVEDLCLEAVKRRFEAQDNPNQTMYIEPSLYHVPVAIGDRGEHVQDMPQALMGTRFPVEGDTVRLFMQWGTGLPAMHLDMDLSCWITYSHKSERCSYSRLTATGCQHSGDIINIPHQVGTAEYIEINLPKLRRAKAQHVIFTCNAYSTGALAPNMVVGWMNSIHPMTVTKAGVAYDPSCVQHQVRITQSLTKGMVFGVLDVAAGQIIWLEMPFFGQTVGQMNADTVKALLDKLDSKLNVGRLLAIKAEAQGLRLIDEKRESHADERYTSEWAMNSAGVTQLLID